MATWNQPCKDPGKECPGQSQKGSMQKQAGVLKEQDIMSEIIHFTHCLNLPENRKGLRGLKKIPTLVE